MILRVLVKPNAKEDSLRRLPDGSLEVKLSVPPEKGKANERLLSLLSRHYGVPRRSLRIVRGERSRRKLIEIDL